jgi:biopolymer transport protein ExbD
MAGGAQNDTDESITGINVTPLVDITLVLLIIFMVTAKLTLSQAIPLDPPKVAPPSASVVQAILSVTVQRDGSIQIDGRPAVDDEAFLVLARGARMHDLDVRAIIKADGAASHGRVIHVLDLLKRAGVVKIAFGVTPERPEK